MTVVARRRQLRLRPRLPGQGIIEFALVVPLFFLLLLGAAEFSWALYTQSTLGHAAQEGARRGMVLTKIPGAFATDGNRSGTYTTLTTCDRTTIVGTAVCHMGGLSLAQSTFLICPSNLTNDDCPSTTSTGPAAPGMRVEVRLDYQYRPLVIGFFPGLNNIVMTGHAEMRTQ